MSRTWRATYRLQLRNCVGFAEAAALLPYLARLGISHLYLSPVMRARSDSPHGYDVVDPNEPDPVLGGGPGFARLLGALRENGMGLVLDIVPNHMAASVENPWWRSVLADGPDSAYADFFDIDWRTPEGAFRPLSLPALEGSLEDAIARGALSLQLVGPERAIELDHQGQRFPIARRTLPIIDPALPVLLDAPHPDASRIKALLARASLPERLAPLLQAQSYRLCPWREALASLSYRRFFDIAELAGLRMEEPRVFAASHALVRELVAAGEVDGLRLDHIDGLADPQRYLADLHGMLAEAGGGEVRVHVEKILGLGEELRAEWPVDGTTGYEFVNAVLHLFVDPAGLDRLGQAYLRLTGDERPFAAVALAAKRQVLAELFQAEVKRVVAAGLDAAAAAGVPVSAAELEAGVVELVTGLDVYRPYIAGAGVGDADHAVLERAAMRARAAARVDPALVECVILLLRGRSEPALRFAARLQQLSGPLMAKALEDTAFYRWHRLIALNEVGGEPGEPALGPAAFHAFNAGRARQWPFSLSATATHDTKRGEDVRARLALLSEDAAVWEAVVARWQTENGPLRTELPDGPAPDPRTEYLFYQTLIGCWPADLAADDAEGLAELAGRLGGYLEKAMRESKERTRWTAIDDAFEAAVQAFGKQALDPARSAGFLAEARALARDLAGRAVVTALGQLLLKLTSPGVPDIYQGTELWDLSLVDPDNRRPVDWELRRQLLDDPRTLPERLRDWPDGAVKFGLLQTVLAERRRCPMLYAGGDYLPLAASGPGAAHVLAFARQAGRDLAITVVPRLVRGWISDSAYPMPDPARWGETRLMLPATLRDFAWVNRLAGPVDAPRQAGADGGLRLGDVLREFPVALLSAVS